MLPVETKRQRVNKDKIEVFFLPPYAPEYNPDEYLNHTLKISVHSGHLPYTAEDISHKIPSFMRKLQHRLPLVSSFFRHPALSHLEVIQSYIPFSNSYSLSEVILMKTVVLILSESRLLPNRSNSEEIHQVIKAWLTEKLRE